LTKSSEYNKLGGMEMTADEKLYVIELYGEIDVIRAPFNENQLLAQFFVHRIRLYVSFADTVDEAIDGIYDQLGVALWIKCME
jgi:hypothetical protein